ncbi:MAG: hypothetical protein FK731_04720 [Asgard group archaeon]|nr:hypothetical protein [Asgard group archaeon]
MADSNNLKEIISALDRLSTLEQSVREFINTTRYQTELLKNLDNWNQICSSLDTIGDTLYSIEDYINAEYPESEGLKYIFTYGILQALFIQQDSMQNLSEAFELQYERSEKLKKIRALRNAAIGHPTKNQVKKVTYYNYISRITLQKWGFTLLRSSEEDRTEFMDVNLLSILEEQIHEIENSYRILVEKLNKDDRMHREKYKDKLLADIFPSSMRYSFEKVSQGIHSPSNSNRFFGLSMLNSIEKTYTKFEDALRERNELDDYTSYDLDEYKHAIAVLKSYLSDENEIMQEKDARIYCFYLSEQHKHFEKQAEEIDSQYNEEVE